jgi:hypothetical protein
MTEKERYQVAVSKAFETMRADFGGEPVPTVMMIDESAIRSAINIDNEVIRVPVPSEPDFKIGLIIGHSDRSGLAASFKLPLSKTEWAGW